MKNLRSVGALLAICGAFSCATAISDGTVPGPNTPPEGGGSDAGGSAGLGEEGGSPATGGSAPQTGGSVGSAGKGEAGKGGSGAGGKGGGAAGSAGKAGSGGTVGTGGSISAGGKGGTGSSGAAGASGGSTGTAGGTSTGPCDNPKDVKQGNSGSLETTGPACLRTQEKFTTVGSSNFAGRTLKVNGTAVTFAADGKTAGPFGAAVDGWNYFDVSAGTQSFASLYWY
jgi:hypothetical protein